MAAPKYKTCAEQGFGRISKVSLQWVCETCGTRTSADEIQMGEGEQWCVRLKPYDPRQNHCLRRFIYRGIKFQEERGWYIVPKHIADHLRHVLQFSGDKYSPLAFDVCTVEEAATFGDKELK